MLSTVSKATSTLFAVSASPRYVHRRHESHPAENTDRFSLHDVFSCSRVCESTDTCKSHIVRDAADHLPRRPTLHYSVSLRIKTYTRLVPLKTHHSISVDMQIFLQWTPTGGTDSYFTSDRMNTVTCMSALSTNCCRDVEKQKTATLTCIINQFSQ